MPDYKTGTYITKPRKAWNCECCKKEIRVGNPTFTRVEEYGDELIRGDGEAYRKKNYRRYHITCANNLKDLSQHEYALLNANVESLTHALSHLEKFGFKIAFQDDDEIILKKEALTP